MKRSTASTSHSKISNAIFSSPFTMPSTPPAESWRARRPSKIARRSPSPSSRPPLPPGPSRAANYTLNYLTGRWAGEWTLNQEPLLAGARVIESRRGSTGHQANPWFAIQAGKPDEDHGEVWFGALAWSGSWRITIEKDQLDAVRVTGGFNPFDFGYVLHPGESLETPIFYGGYSAHGLGGASRILHHFEIAHVLPHRQGAGETAAPKPRPVIYNSWEATEMNVTEAGQEALAEKAAALGVDRFVMDDGWFGQRKNGSRRPGRLVREPGEISPRPQAAHRQGALARHGLRPVGRAGNGQPRLRSLSQASRLGAQFPRPPAHRAAQSACAQPRPSRCARLRLSASSTSSSPKTTSPSSSGTTTATGASRGGISFPPPSRRRSTSSSRATSIPFLPSYKPSIPRLRSSPAPAAADASISAFCNTPTRSGPPTIPIPSTA